MPLDKMDLDRQSVTEKGENAVISCILVSPAFPRLRVLYTLKSFVDADCGVGNVGNLV